MLRAFSPTSLLVTVGASLSLVGCFSGDTKVQYTPDMADSPAIEAMEDFLDPPEGSIAMNHIEYGSDASETGLLFSELNPYGDCLQLAPEVAADSKRLYESRCSHCHGNEGRGKGRLGENFPAAPDLMLEYYADNVADGYFLHTITHGAVVMPKLGDKTTLDERWRIICHIRTMQKAVLKRNPKANTVKTEG